MPYQPITQLISNLKRKLTLRGESPITIKNYVSRLRKFNRFLRRHNLSVYELKPEHIEQFLFELKRMNLADSSILVIYHTIKTFLRLNNININFDDIAVPKFTKQIDFAVLDEDDTRRIINNAPSYKIRLMLWLGYECALRASELCKLQVKHIDFKRKTLLVYPAKKKGNIAYEIPILDDELLKELEEYIKIEQLKPNDYLFYGRTKDSPMNSSYFSVYIFSPIIKRLGLDKKYGRKIRYHDFARHSRATNLLRNGVDIYTVNRLLRHSRIDSTTVYLHLVAEDLRDRLMRFGVMKDETK